MNIRPNDYVVAKPDTKTHIFQVLEVSNELNGEAVAEYYLAQYANPQMRSAYVPNEAPDPADEVVTLLQMDIIANLGQTLRSDVVVNQVQAVQEYDYAIGSRFDIQLLADLDEKLRFIKPAFDYWFNEAPEFIWKRRVNFSIKFGNKLSVKWQENERTVFIQDSMLSFFSEEDARATVGKWLGAVIWDFVPFNVRVPLLKAASAYAEVEEIETVLLIDAIELRQSVTSDKEWRADYKDEEKILTKWAAYLKKYFSITKPEMMALIRQGEWEHFLPRVNLLDGEVNSTAATLFTEHFFAFLKQHDSELSQPVQDGLQHIADWSGWFDCWTTDSAAYDTVRVAHLEDLEN